MDPFVILGWANAGLSFLSGALSVAHQILALVVPFI